MFGYVLLLGIYGICICLAIWGILIVTRGVGWLQKRAKKNKGEISDDYKARIRQFISDNKPNDVVIFFKPFYYNDTLGASLLFRLKSTYFITLTQEWKYRILFDDVEHHDLLINTYLETIGHEKAHLDIKALCPTLPGKKRWRMKKWVDEVHADFGACEAVFGGNRSSLVEVLKYKKRIQKKVVGSDRRHCTHPCWRDRIYYARKYDFDDKLIRRIAQDVGLKDQKYLDKLINYYYSMENPDSKEKRVPIILH